MQEAAVSRSGRPRSRPAAPTICSVARRALRAAGDRKEPYYLICARKCPATRRRIFGAHVKCRWLRCCALRAVDIACGPAEHMLAGQSSFACGRGPERLGRGSLAALVMKACARG